MFIPLFQEPFVSKNLSYFNNYVKNYDGNERNRVSFPE